MDMEWHSVWLGERAHLKRRLRIERHRGYLLQQTLLIHRKQNDCRRKVRACHHWAIA
jgi:hypothetical protein